MKSIKALSSFGHHKSKPPVPPTSPVHVPEPKSFDFALVEDDEATQRDRFVRDIACPPGEAYSMFCQFVWRENAGVGLHPESWVEIKQDSNPPGGLLEVGMIRIVAGYEEEITHVVKDSLIEYRINSGMPSTFHKGRVVFKPVEGEQKKTSVIWTILWSPNSAVTGIVYKLMMTGFCNLALYNLERKLAGQPPVAEHDEGPASAPSSSGLEEGVLKEGEVPTLQYAARLQTGYEGNLTAQQERSLHELLAALKAQDPEAYALLQAHPDGPTRMALRFLRAECHGKHRDFNVAKSQKRLVETLRFRRDVGADQMLTTAPPSFEAFCKIGGELEILDREGRIVIFSRAGLLSVHLDPKALTDDEWKQNLVCITERRMQMLRDSSKKMGHEVSATVIVYDLKGMSFASRNIIPFTKVINSIASVHYVEMVDVIVLANAPGIFSSIWALIKGFLDPVTRSKVQVFSAGKSDKERLAKFLRTICDAKLLPKEYGGDSDVVVPLPGPAAAAGVRI